MVQVPDEGQIRAFTDFLEKVVVWFGPKWIIGIVGVTLGGLFAWRIYANHRQDRGIQLALDEKDRTIVYLQNQVRMLQQIVFKKQFGLSDTEIQAVLLKIEPPGGPDSGA